LGLSSPEPRYVKRIDPISNIITVAKKDSIYSDRCVAKNVNWLVDEPTFPLKTYAKIRYNSPGGMALIERIDDIYAITFENPQLAITPGQSVVFYDDDTLIGGGIIEVNND
jgi:tRNA-specific 2-thiouridylase